METDEPSTTCCQRYYPISKSSMRRVWFNQNISSIYTALRLIRADGADIYNVTYTSTDPHSSGFLVADQKAVEPRAATDSDYSDWCLAFCETQGLEIFIPGRGAKFLAQKQQAFLDRGTRLMVTAPHDVLALLENKAEFYHAVSPDVARVPDFRVVKNLPEFDRAFAELRALHKTLCIKPSVSSYGLGFRILDEQCGSGDHLLDGVLYHIGLSELRLSLSRRQVKQPLIVMEYLDGPEYSVDCVGDGRQLICAVPRRKPTGSERGQLIESRPDILASVASLTAAYHLSGLFNIQFREGRNGIRLLEINTRLSGGIGMACAAGPNLPLIALKVFDKGFSSVEVPPIMNGVRVGEVHNAFILS